LPLRKVDIMAKTKNKRSNRKGNADSSALRIVGGLALAAGAAAVGYLTRNRWSGIFGTPAAPGGHAIPDLAPDMPHPGPEDRAPEHFRPDPTAVPTAEEREALRPATGAGPTLVKGQADELVRADAVPS
jgi:hypothetical protein